MNCGSEWGIGESISNPTRVHYIPLGANALQKGLKSPLLLQLWVTRQFLEPRVATGLRERKNPN